MQFSSITFHFILESYRVGRGSFAAWPDLIHDLLQSRGHYIYNHLATEVTEPPQSPDDFLKYFLESDSLLKLSINTWNVLNYFNNNKQIFS